MNPYHNLFDRPERVDALEHRSECHAGMAIPWFREAPRADVNFEYHIAIEEMRTEMRARRARLRERRCA